MRSTRWCSAASGWAPRPAGWEMLTFRERQISYLLCWKCWLFTVFEVNSWHITIVFSLFKHQTVAEMLKTFVVTTKKLVPTSAGNGTVYTIFCLQGAAISPTCVSSKVVLPLAYVVFTSGTTGIPKVVKVPHQCILPNILHLRWVQ